MRIEEDWERVSELDKMYFAEYQKELEEEYWQWEQQQKKPAKIKLYKLRKYETDNKSIPVWRTNKEEHLP